MTGAIADDPKRAADDSKRAATDPKSATTARAVAFVAARRAQAEMLGAELGAEIGDPGLVAERLRRGLADLADPEYLAGQLLVAPGIGATHGVRWPLLAAVGRGFRHSTRSDNPARLLDVATRLLRERELEAHWFAFGLLERAVSTQPERAWQLLRDAAARSADWITVDTLARAYGRGILVEPIRWAELEQLVYSPSRWERRLVGSTVATIPHVDRRLGRQPEIVRHGLELMGELIGDDDPDVRKALSWALRTLAQLDGPSTATFLAVETERAARDRDGHRAWVIRDALPKLAPAVSAPLRARLEGIRVRSGAPSTSRAAETRRAFAGLGIGLDVAPAERRRAARP